jgi:hypothetical protein
MALTQAQIDAFENLKAGLFNGGKILTGEQDLLVALVTMSDQVAALTQALTGKQASVAAVGGQFVPQITLNWQLDPKRLDETLMVTTDVEGYISVSVVQFPILVLAGGSTSFVVPPPPGNVAILLAPLEIVTDNVGALVVVEASIDGHDAIGPQGFVLGPSTNLAIHQYYVAQSAGMLITLTNSSPEDATIWFKGELMTMAVSFYNSFYAPAHNIAYDAIKSELGLSD